MRALAVGLLALVTLGASGADTQLLAEPLVKLPAEGSEVPGEMLVKLRSSSALGVLLAKHQLTLVARSGDRPIYRLRVAGLADDARLKMAALLLEPDVLIVEPNFVLQTPEASKNGAWAIGTEAEYAVQWAPLALRLPEAQWRSTGAGVRVAVLDTGIDTQHPALVQRLLPGFDFVDRDTDPSEVGTPLDRGFGHGTHVAGLVAMVAPGARIMPLRVLDAAGRGDVWSLSEALLHAVDPDGDPTTDDGAHVVNLSLGTTLRTRMLPMIARLGSCSAFAVASTDVAEDVSDHGYDKDRSRCSVDRGPVVVAAAGNDASDTVRQYPAAESAGRLLAVTASTVDGRLAGFSNFGSWVHLAAPGEGLTSTVPGGGYATWSGTSMASPLVAGAAALVRAAAPTLATKDVVRRLLDATTPLCGTSLRQLDAAASLWAPAAPVRVCP